MLQPSLMMFGAVVGSTIVADQASKWCARGLTREQSGSAVDMGLLRLEPVSNDGLAFGLQSGSGTQLVPVSVGIVLLASVWAYWGISSSPELRVKRLLAAALILAGGMSNIGDRVFAGSVTDFIRIGHGPIFNIADIALAAGCLTALIVAVLRVVTAIRSS